MTTVYVANFLTNLNARRHLTGKSNEILDDVFQMNVSWAEPNQVLPVSLKKNEVCWKHVTQMLYFAYWDCGFA